MSETTEKIMEQIEQSEKSKLNSWIAVIVAISASLMAFFNIKDNNIVQAMAQAQANTVDAWSYYQAKGTKLNLVENQKSQLELQLMLNEKISPQVKLKIHQFIDESKIQISKYEQEKTEIKNRAENFQKEYEELNYHDDQFDLAEALISLGLSIFGITALTNKKPLFYFGLLFSFSGLLFGFAGFLNWKIHPEFLTKLFG